MEQSIPDFGKLEKDVLKAINDDVLYWQQNDAKLRAVNQQVPTYEDFRDMVKAAHLNPLDKKDTLRIQPTSVWNSSARIKGNWKREEKQETQKDSGFRVPVSCVQFVRDWRETEPAKRFDYVEFVGRDRLAKLHETELGFELMGDLIRVLRDHVADAPELALDLLDLMSRSKRFALDTQLLSEHEKTACKELLQSLNNYTQHSLFKELEKKYIMAIS